MKIKSVRLRESVFVGSSNSESANFATGKDYDVLMADDMRQVVIVTKSTEKALALAVVPISNVRQWDPLEEDVERVIASTDRAPAKATPKPAK